MPADSPPQCNSLDIYLIAIGGTGMAPLACLLEGLGHQVRGSDGPLYPPMSTLLEEAGIEPLLGPDPTNLKPAPDLVIVGNAVHRNNPEALAVEASGVERISMPDAVARFLLENRTSLVVAGTHGKTTTTSMAATCLEILGQSPGWLIGGRPIDLPSSHALGGDGSAFVIEGDEYNAAYFDRGPKFLHYQAKVAIITSVEYDHADLYPDALSFRRAFRDLVVSLPADGHLVLCVDTPELRELAQYAPCPVTTYSLTSANNTSDTSDTTDAEARHVQPSGEVLVRNGVTSFEIDGPAGAARFEIKVPGRHNSSNALAVWCALRAMGLEAQPIADALSQFRGVARRLQELGRPNDVVVVDDFAHHPTAVKASLEGLRARHPERRLVALIEPRSLTAGRAFLFDDWLDALQDADHVLLAPIFHAKRFQPEQLLDLPRLAREVGNRGGLVDVCESTEELYERALLLIRPGDVVVTMTSGAFDGIPARLLLDLAE